MFLSTVLAGRCVVVLLALLVPLLLLLLIGEFGRVARALIVIFEQEHHFLHGVHHALD